MLSLPGLEENLRTILIAIIKTRPSTQLAAFNMVLNNPAVALTKKLIDSVFKDPETATMLPVDTWRMNVTEYLSGLKKLEAQSIFEIRQLVQEKQEAVLLH